jgi:hypothetical protein
MANFSEKIKRIKGIYNDLKEDLWKENNEINDVLDAYTMLPQSEKDKWKKSFYFLFTTTFSDEVNNLSVEESTFQYYLEGIGITIQDRIDFLGIFDKKPYLSELSNSDEFHEIWDGRDLIDYPNLKDQINEVKLQTLFNEEDADITELKEHYERKEVNPDELKITILYILFNEIV